MLVDGVVELGEGIAHLAAADKHLIPLRQMGILRAALGQRAHLHRVHGDEGGLNERLLHLLVEGLVQGVAPRPGHALHVHAYALGQLHGGVIIALNGHEVGAGDILHGIGHGDALPAGGQIHVVTQPLDVVGAEDLLGGPGEDALQNIHHAVQIGVGLIQLTGGELRVVLGVHALVAEDAAHLVYPLQTAHDEPLQVQLRGDPHIHIDILSVVVGDEGPGVGAAGNGAEHGGLHLHEAHIVQIPAQIRHELAADLKVPLGFGIHNEIHIPLAVAQLLVRQTVELLRQGLEGLRQQGDLVGPDAHLTLLGAEHVALDAYDITDVIFPEAVIGLLVHLVLPGVDLDAAGLILQIAEGHLAHAPLAHKTARQRDGLPLQLVELVLDLLCVMGHVIAGDLEGVHTRLLQGCQLIPADLENFPQVLLILILLCHRYGLLIVRSCLPGSG